MDFTRVRQALTAAAVLLILGGMVQGAGQAATKESGRGDEPTMGAGTSAARPGELSQDKLESYIQAREFIESQDPALKKALESGQVTAGDKKLETLLTSQHRAWPSPEEFARIHEQVQKDPALKARVEAKLKKGTATGTSGTTSSSGAEPAASPR